MKTILYTSRSSEEESINISKAATAILQSELIAFPTETVYGLGADVFDERAIKKIFRVKKRPADNPLIVHVETTRWVERLYQKIPKYFHTLAEAFWPGPLSLIGYKHASVSDLVTARLSKIAVRMPDHSIALRLMRAVGVPLVAPSANLSGSVSPTTARDVLRDLDGKIFGVLDGGPCNVGIESTVLDISSHRVRILRPGKITAEEIEDVIHQQVVYAKASLKRPASPGMKYMHYAPKAYLMLFFGDQDHCLGKMLERLYLLKFVGGRVGVLAPEKMRSNQFDAFYSLGKGDAVDYARGMYTGMSSLDDKDLDVIFCPAISEEGLGVAVMNRLRKAASEIVR